MYRFKVALLTALKVYHQLNLFICQYKIFLGITNKVCEGIYFFRPSLIGQRLCQLNSFKQTLICNYMNGTNNLN
jgi:hypothetical protein